MVPMMYSPHVLELQGRCDTHSSADLRQQFEQLAQEVSATETSAPVWLLDLSQVSSIDSSGLSAFIAGFKLARQQGGALLFCAPSDPVRMVFEIAQLDRVFPIYESQAAALAAWEQQTLEPTFNPLAA
ncbi:MAG: STAS domain-containing protein [Limnothrix sp.]|jgi:anti-anti-sigma factor|nr:STAS domain-containing protein [Limnothrix sp.]RFP62699.1 MAG: anti-sigma factor antagonist [Limnothrix sp. CACIAM 69d]